MPLVAAFFMRRPCCVGPGNLIPAIAYGTLEFGEFVDVEPPKAYGRSKEEFLAAVVAARREGDE